ncbi:MAG: hypothetical protein HYW08_04115, partial [candidate division NC10 bacterium]|nr:hypothetical protein [candidate division NC10 bacterium]
YAATVRVAHEAFRRGDLFEVVPGRTFFEPCAVPPSELFRRLIRFPLQVNGGQGLPFRLRH